MYVLKHIETKFSWTIGSCVLKIDHFFKKNIQKTQFWHVYYSKTLIEMFGHCNGLNKQIKIEQIPLTMILVRILKLHN